jgi:uncharacterized phage protein (TIGR01671 family)
MRDIKFRAWDESRSKMVYNFSGKPVADGYQLFHEDGGMFCGNHQDNGDWQQPELMQYTGLKDKNGKEIYEGDVVEDRFGRKMLVGEWNYRLCWIAITETNFHHADFFDWVESINGELSGIAKVEIIGNIYENPELLKK